VDEARYSIVVPCYNSGPWIDELVDRIDQVMAPVPGGYELILVNDASSDAETWTAIARNARERLQVRAIDLMFNVGQFRALICGFEASVGEFVITMDDDLQNPPEEIPKLIRAMDSRPDMEAVIAAYESKAHSWMRNLGTRLIASIYARGFGKPKGLQTTSFRILRRKLVNTICEHHTVKPVIGALILQSTSRLMNTPVEHHPRRQGKSGYRLNRLVGATLDNIIHGSTAPLRTIGLTGILTAFISLGFGLVYLVRAISGQIGQPGFATIVLLLFFFGGMTLAAVGILGEYVVRVVTEVTGPPRYAVRSRLGWTAPPVHQSIQRPNQTHPNQPG
jgi:glycosyltransferase involved in cell wall biosynthesis